MVDSLIFQKLACKIDQLVLDDDMIKLINPTPIYMANLELSGKRFGNSGWLIYLYIYLDKLNNTVNTENTEGKRDMNVICAE